MVRVTFRGFFGLDDSQTPTGYTWESADTFVMHAYDMIEPEYDDSLFHGYALIRCTVSTTSCVRVTTDVLRPMIGHSS